MYAKNLLLNKLINSYTVIIIKMVGAIWKCKLVQK